MYLERMSMAAKRRRFRRVFRYRASNLCIYRAVRWPSSSPTMRRVLPRGDLYYVLKLGPIDGEGEQLALPALCA